MKMQVGSGTRRENHPERLERLERLERSVYMYPLPLPPFLFSPPFFLEKVEV
jgi:hypothetical protein